MAVSKKKTVVVADGDNAIAEVVNNKPWYEEVDVPVYIPPPEIPISGVKPGHQEVDVPVYIPPDNPVVSDRKKPWQV